MQMPNDAAEQLAHETKLRDDLDYAIQCRTETIFNDLPAFEEFMFDGHEAARLIVRELLRALYVERFNETYPLHYLNVVDAISNCNDALDSKIKQIVESEQ
jgi:hypothetical protein